MVRNIDLGESDIYRSLQNTGATNILARISSTFGSGCTSLLIFSLSGLRSMEIHTSLNFFSMTAMPVHQGVGLLTLETKPMSPFLAIPMAGREMFVARSHNRIYPSNIPTMSHCVGNLLPSE